MPRVGREERARRHHAERAVYAHAVAAVADAGGRGPRGGQRMLLKKPRVAAQPFAELIHLVGEHEIGRRFPGAPLGAGGQLLFNRMLPGMRAGEGAPSAEVASALQQLAQHARVANESHAPLHAELTRTLLLLARAALVQLAAECEERLFQFGELSEIVIVRARDERRLRAQSAWLAAASDEQRARRLVLVTAGSGVFWRMTGFKAHVPCMFDELGYVAQVTVAGGKGRGKGRGTGAAAVAAAAAAEFGTAADAAAPLAAGTPAAVAARSTAASASVAVSSQAVAPTGKRTRGDAALPAFDAGPPARRAE
jgi:hypothetical protein